jgi:hypothetical protein
MYLGCEGGKMPDSTDFKAKLSKVPDSAWKSLSEKRIYFGHQSVGDNIIAGIGDIQAHGSRIGLKISKLEKAGAIREPGFYHSYVGRNEDPKSKVDDFVTKIESGLGDSADIAFFKFCYIDVNPSTDVAGLFRHYKNAMEKLKNKFPRVTFIHSTMPLVKLQDGPKAWIKKILGKPLSGMEDNLKRDEYNSLIVSEYGAKEPLFDLAKAESTFPDGARSVITKNGRSFHALVPGFTYDDGHLNEAGRKAVAASLLSFLAQLPEK